MLIIFVLIILIIIFYFIGKFNGENFTAKEYNLAILGGNPVGVITSNKDDDLGKDSSNKTPTKRDEKSQAKVITTVAAGTSAGAIPVDRNQQGIDTSGNIVNNPSNNTGDNTGNNNITAKQPILPTSPTSPTLTVAPGLIADVTTPIEASIDAIKRARSRRRMNRR